MLLLSFFRLANNGCGMKCWGIAGYFPGHKQQVYPFYRNLLFHNYPVRNLHQEITKIVKLKNLELLYLNNNKFIELPKQVMSLEHLQYLDLKDNNINPNIPELNNVNFGFRINLK